ncbi:polygalacturonase-like isoform X1 [Magnolia sinica]|uniref:polygalacturonase-like n=1 Tax=Magnolia sinica TaxID=86752 RepID=UPI00265AAFF4|nr:polygalacturonase-like [Magnolia sinica]XP_058101927.1 polygalacturonase-like isoform X1 [Magnolia sinica]
MEKPMHFLLSFLFIVLPSAQGDYSILDFGAKPDGVTDSTKSFLSAWATACASAESTTIHVPPGSYLLGQTVFAGPCKNNGITIRIDGTLVAPANYVSLGSSGHWLFFNDVQGVSVYGGTLDGRGSGLWACKASSGNCPAGAESLTFNNAKDILISGLTSMNSKLYHIVIDGCANVIVQGVKIVAPGNSPNTDGIHVQQSTGVTITGTSIKTGDDCISVGPGTMNLWVENIACGPGHGISIGSLGKELNEAGVQNVTVKTVVFTGTENGLRIKSWGRPSNGFVKGVTFEHAVMQNVQNPIIIDQNYCPHQEDCPDQNSGVKISEVTYNDIHGSSATQVAVKFDCSTTHPCSGIGLQDVKLTYKNQPSQSSCMNADGNASGFVVPPSCL